MATIADRAPSANPSTTPTWTVKIRFAGQKRAERLTTDGGTTTRRVHAAMITDKAHADRIATEIIVQNNDGTVEEAWVEPF